MSESASEGSPARWWAWRIIAASAGALFVALAVFVWYPHWRDARLQRTLTEADNLFQTGRAEAALSHY